MSLVIANGTATNLRTLSRNAFKKTNPKLVKMIRYKIVQIRKLVDGAGVQLGLLSELFQSIQGIGTCYY